MHRFSLALLALSRSSPAVASGQVADSSLLSLRRIYGSPEFRPEPFGPARWLARGAAYTTLERSRETEGGQDLVRYDVATGDRTVLVAAARLKPAGDTMALTVEAYSWSKDEGQLLVFTNSKPVWRQNTRGDYWVLDLHTWRLRRLGGSAAKPSTLMFAKFSPDGRRVGYVRENDLYVEDLATGRIIRLTRDGSRTIINGTFDWVYEEELDDRDGWRWSPDGHTIAFWQLNADSVKNFDLLNNTDSLYPQVVPVQYPKAGESNSAARVGTVPAVGGRITWFQVPGDPRNNYIARMEWAESSDEVVIEHLNRLQNTNTVYLGNRTTGAVRPVLVEQDSAWVDVVDQITWLGAGKSFIWQSERDGWKHLYRVSRDGKTVTLLTPGAYDVAEVAAVDEAGGSLYFTASPDNPSQRYLYRVGLDGTGTAERVTPAELTGTHTYNVAPNGTVAFHSYSRFGVPPITELVQLPGHQVSRTLVANTQLKGRIATLQKGPVEFFQVDVGNGVKLNGWVMKPLDFNPNQKYPLFFTNYGGPGSQTVLDGWGGSNYLWNLYLTQKGYLVASVDNRGTGMRGRDVAEDRLPATRRDRNPGPGQCRAGDGAVAICGFDQDRRLRVELWRLHEPERAVPGARCLPHGHRRRAGDALEVLR